MIRRHFLTISAAALSLSPMPLRAAYDAVAYDRTLPRALRETGDSVIFNFRTSWSWTCQMKEEILADLLRENPDYRRLTFVDVDWDTYGPSEWAERRMKVRRQSTLVAMKGADEIARIENDPRRQSLQGLLDAALAA